MILIVKPKPIILGSYRVIRGDGWFVLVSYPRQAYFRSALCPRFLDNDRGFRIILRKRIST